MQDWTGNSGFLDMATIEMKLAPLMIIMQQNLRLQRFFLKMKNFKT